MQPVRVGIVSLALALGIGMLGGCDRDQRAEPARDHVAEDAAVAAQEAPARSERPAPRREASAQRQASTQLISGRPMWADSRRYSAEENAAYQFDQHGAELEAADLDDFLKKAHRFVNDPPAGARTLVRANGDRLLYDARSGLFGVARSDGAPRTVFKPDDGDAYWAKQVRDVEAGGARTAALR